MIEESNKKEISMPSYKILSCDLDGTLLVHGTHVSEENDRAIRTLAATPSMWWTTF